jgi:hypothetical protein
LACWPGVLVQNILAVTGTSKTGDRYAFLYAVDENSSRLGSSKPNIGRTDAESISPNQQFELNQFPPLLILLSQQPAQFAQ